MTFSNGYRFKIEHTNIIQSVHGVRPGPISDQSGASNFHCSHRFYHFHQIKTYFGNRQMATKHTIHKIQKLITAPFFAVQWKFLAPI